jgi:amino acid adenylation domain-containing protein
MRSVSTLAHLLANSAGHHAGATAVVDPVSGESISYGELFRRARELTHDLARHGLKPGDRVGICAPKTITTVVSIFGILGARGVYVPVDVSAPAARNAGIFSDCDVRMIVVAPSAVEALRAAMPGRRLEKLADLGENLVLVGESEKPSTVSSNAGSPDDVAYILYTSGSTGKPKGVVHTNDSALAFIDWCSEAFAPNPTDRFSSHAPFHFDLSILDLYVPIKHGASLILIGEDIGKQPARLAPLISEQRISIWYSTPSILRLLSEYGKLSQLDYSALRFVLFAGEVFPLKHLRAIKSFWNHPRYFNLYGPTETNVCTYYEVPAEIPESRTEPFPIGFECSDDRCMVVDDDLPVEMGDEGELVVTGGSVMQGYWNMPERSEASFLTDAEGVRWYRTGDLVRETAEDGYVFVGRRDRMVKRRGYRVELGEIEAALYRHPLVTEAAVISVPDEINGVLIKSFLSTSSTERPSLVQMKMFCVEQLPAYMIPDRFVFAERLPKTSTDKIDYQKLKDLA